MKAARWAGGLLPALLAGWAAAGTAYVSDELILGVYSEQNNQGQRLATLHSGANVETLSVNGDFTQVQLNDGVTGWVKSAYLTTREPAAARIKQLQDELDRSRATTPALAEAAARSELEQLKRELKARQAELEAARAARTASAPAAAAAADTARTAAASGVSAPQAQREAAAAPTPTPTQHAGMAVLALLAALACGFWLGYSTLARRVRQKFGGIKVY